MKRRLEMVKWTFLQPFLRLEVGGCAERGGGKAARGTSSAFPS